MHPADTIVAIASPAGRGAIGIVRVSGPEVPRIAMQVLGRIPAPRSAELARFLDSDGGSLDEGLALYFPAPASFTGEHVLELQGHGGAVVLDLLVRRIVELGCRNARAGEFSERAFLNGKIDIAQAEAIADLIDAGSAAAARAAVRSLQGAFSARVHELQARLTQLRAFVEAAIDFPDEEIETLSDGALNSQLAGIFEAFDALLLAAQQGALLKHGLTVVIAGKPNAGKSSLLNRLVGDDVAIVADLPGTTRDLLREQVHLDGMPLNLIDTAGLRSAAEADVVEAEGIRRAIAEITRADRVLYVVDAGAARGDDLEQLVAAFLPTAQGVPVTVVFNKIDLAAAPSRDVAPAPSEATGGADAPHGTEAPRLFVSAKTGEGIDLLRSHLKASAGYTSADSTTLAARTRHLDALRRARSHLERAADALSSTRAAELFAEDLRLSQQALGEITGEFGSDDLLGEIFRSFCIGK
jgi:tRNA modification GTPase